MLSHILALSIGAIIGLATILFFILLADFVWRTLTWFFWSPQLKLMGYRFWTLPSPAKDHFLGRKSK